MNVPLLKTQTAGKTEKPANARAWRRLFPSEVVTVYKQNMIIDAYFSGYGSPCWVHPTHIQTTLGCFITWSNRSDSTKSTVESYVCYLRFICMNDLLHQKALDEIAHKSRVASQINNLKWKVNCIRDFTMLCNKQSG